MYTHVITRANSDVKENNAVVILSQEICTKEFVTMLVVNSTPTDLEARNSMVIMEQ